LIKGKHTKICITLIIAHRSDKADDKIVFIAALPIVIAVEITYAAWTRFFIGFNLSLKMLGIFLTAFLVRRTAPFGFLNKS